MLYSSRKRAVSWLEIVVQLSSQDTASVSVPVATLLRPSLSSFLYLPLAGHTHTYHTFTPMFTTMASRRSKTREVTPSPRSLASQQLQRNVYLVPWVGTAKHSSSTSQQLSGEAPSWPSCEVHHPCEALGRAEKEVFPAQCLLPAFCSHPEGLLLICWILTGQGIFHEGEEIEQVFGLIKTRPWVGPAS